MSDDDTKDEVMHLLIAGIVKGSQWRNKRRKYELARVVGIHGGMVRYIDHKEWFYETTIFGFRHQFKPA